MSILYLAADPRELSGLLRHLTDISTADLPVHYARRARFHGEPATLVANGAGASRAMQALDCVHAGGGLQSVVNVGFCGALDPELRIADIFAATEVRHEGAVRAALLPSRRCQAGPLASIDHVAQTAAEKRSLFATGARAVEMEAGGAAARAAHYGLPFYSIRSVTDLADEIFVCDFNAALRENGMFSTTRLLASALQRPFSGFPELLRLRQRSIAASNSLGDFLASCRF